VKVVIIVFLGATLCAVMTWITPMCLKSKVIVRRIDVAKPYWRSLIEDLHPDQMTGGDTR
jgi:hypothetical protein